jgi:tetratricopeptide (TPR) repeat protein
LNSIASLSHTQSRLDTSMKIFLPLSLFVLLLPAQQKPDHIALGTWVREDLFAGMIADDKPRLELGLSKLELVLNADPNNASAIVWRGCGEFIQAVHAYEAGHNADFSREYADAQASFERAALLKPRSRGVYAVIAVTNASLAERLPGDLRQSAYERAYEAWRMDRQLAEPLFASLPEHSKGEMLAGLAHSAQHLGKVSESRGYLTEMIGQLPGTAFEARAKRWLEHPDLLAKSRLSCQSCHEPGRLGNQPPTQGD